MGASRERRKSTRHQAAEAPQLTIALYEDGVRQSEVAADLVDYSNWGIRVNTTESLHIGSLVSVCGLESIPDLSEGKKRSAHVVHCAQRPGEGFRVGLVFQEFGDEGSWSWNRSASEHDPSIDFYEVLQVSPNADLDTIQRVYRLLAQRYHPDNLESGDEETFKRLLQAHRVLSDPAKRAAYDAGYRAEQRRRWKIFNQPEAAQGVDAERRKRWGVVSLLYTKKMHEPHKPGLSLRELEDLLDCPREHLEFSLWYLIESGLIVRADNARCEITVKGVNWAERSGEWPSRRQRLLQPSESNEPRGEEPPCTYSEAPDERADRAS